MIRLIRIIKLYKYVMKSLAAKEEDEQSKSKKKKKRKQVEVVIKDVEPEESEFKKETDPSKLGGALGDAINRKTIIGVLLLLMVLPLFTASEIDYSGEYGLREAFWFGRSSCTDEGGFYCNRGTWITKEGWRELLRGLTRSAQASEVGEDDQLVLINRKELLWLFLPDFEKNGAMDHIVSIPGLNEGDEPFWVQDELCSGF